MNIARIFDIPSLTDVKETEQEDGRKRGVKTQGPVKYRVQTRGQYRRAQHRALQRTYKKNRKAQIRSYFATKKTEGIIRTRLQFAGVLDFATDFQPSTEERVKATLRLVTEFGVRNDDGDFSLAQVDVRTALQNALSFWGSLVGREDTLPEDFKPVIFA